MIPVLSQPATDEGTPPIAPAEVYRARCERFARERDEAGARWNRVANLRLLAFAAAALCVVFGVRQREWLIAAAGLVALGAFVALAVYQRRLGWQRDRAEHLRQIDEEAGRRLARAWDELPVRHATRADPAHPYAADLDLFGRASLRQLLDAVGTPVGAATLDGWLLAPAMPEVVRERQAAVAELAPQLDLRDELTLRGRLIVATSDGPEHREGRATSGDRHGDRAEPDDVSSLVARRSSLHDLAPFLAWAEGEGWLERRRWLISVAWVSPALLWASVAAQVAGLLPLPLWPLFVAVNLLVSQTAGRAAYRVIARVAAYEGAFGHYAASFRLLAGATFEAPQLRRVQGELGAGPTAADPQLRRLHRLLTFQLPQGSLIHLPAQLAGLWDLHLLAALERWQAAVGGHARAWLAALGEVEALAALAVLAHDNPDWAFPAFDGAADRLAARDLGHPLLPAERRVVNDVEVGPRGTFLLVTGSNMSGKSTLLRAIGVNLALAGAGGPVCASALTTPPVELWTSVRVRDSLEEGVSLYLAELLRLKQIVDAARRVGGTPGSGGWTVLYLLDEILQGTNTAERQIAARRIIRALVAQGALGAVTTHDLTLAARDELAGLARPVHFTETIRTAPDPLDRPPPRHPGDWTPAFDMVFDYRLRPGLATSTNALKLMELVGLQVDDEGAAGADEGLRIED